MRAASQPARRGRTSKRGRGGQCQGEGGGRLSSTQVIGERPEVVIKRAPPVKRSRTLNVAELESDTERNAQGEYIGEVEGEGYNPSDEEEETGSSDVECNALEKSDEDIYVSSTPAASQAVKSKVCIPLTFVALSNTRVVIVTNNHS